MREATRRIYRANGVEIDSDLGRIRRNGGEAYLRRKAHLLLMCLIEHRSAPVSKEELVRVVWDGAAITDDTLVNCVQEIRKALGDDARSPVFIRTMPKMGYWFVAPLEELEEEAAPIAEGRAEVPFRPKWRHWKILGLAAALSVFFGWKLWLSPRPGGMWEVGWWKLDEGAGATIRDAVSGAAASLPPGVSWTPGVSGSALRFGGGDLVVAGKGSRLLPVGAAPRTVMAWVKTSSNSGDATTVFHYGHPNPNEPFGSIALVMHQSGSAGVFSSRSSVISQKRLDDDRWHQIAGVFEGASRRARVFVDGVEEASEILREAFLQAGAVSQWSIGRAMWGGTPFRGAVDDVRVFARALRPAEIQALYRCVSGAIDLEISGRGPYYFVPVSGLNVSVEPRPDGEASARVRNTGRDYAGVAFVRREAGCALNTTLASDFGQDLQIEADVRVGGNATDRVAEAGPYFRSRRSSAGDGIVGGTSAGYWVQLKSTGQVRVRRLYPSSTVAFSAVPPQFDPEIFHKLTATVHGNTVTVTLDSRVLEFDQAGMLHTEVEIPPDWESASPKGRNQGTAGIAFSCEGNRGRAGGQEARNIRVR